MSPRVSSFRADLTQRRWFREPWPWFLMAGPLAVVVASLASAWIAVASDDGVVADDYYKQGLLINQRLADTARERVPAPVATISFAGDGAVRVHLDDLPAPPARLRLTLAHPGERAPVGLALWRVDNGDWVGAFFAQPPGRWIVRLESDAWRWPVTTVEGRLSEIRLGAAGRS
jgi:hypothetical protein